MPGILIDLAIVSIALALLSAIGIAIDLTRRPQPMAIMDIVWPVTALYSGPIGVWAYAAFGRAKPRPADGSRPMHPMAMSDRGEPTSPQVALATTHCGAGCTLGDLVAEALIGAVAVGGLACGWHVFRPENVLVSWPLDFVFAFVIGIGFQYYSIKPMHPDMPVSDALLQALKADALSLMSWQIGMYVVMGLAHFWIFPHLLHLDLQPASLVFWWVMQIAMLAGFATAYPVNRFLIVHGIKSSM